jgi:hypothetical protein
MLARSGSLALRAGRYLPSTLVDSKRLLCPFTPNGGIPTRMKHRNDDELLRTNPEED